jgi:phosphate transport system permease protein
MTELKMNDQNEINRMRLLIKRLKFNDYAFSIIGLVCMMIAVLTLLGLFGNLVLDGLQRLNYDFFTSFPSRRAAEAGILSAWVGSVLVLSVTAFVGVPLGIAAAIWLEEYAPKNLLTAIIEINVSNLAGVPSIIYGLLALGLFVYQLDLGQSIVTAGLTLALLILPIIIVSTRESLRTIPREIREAAYALGATRWRMIADHVLPYSKGGILTGVIIGMARAIGETAPIITIGALTFIAFLPPIPFDGDPPAGPFDWLFSAFTVLPIQMFNWVSRPEEAFLINAAATGVVIIVMTLVMNALAIYLRYKIRKNIKW